MILQRIRKALGKNQKEMAEILGLSLRALQSYEQQWRSVPQSIEKLTTLLYYLVWRQSNNSTLPCWEIMGCNSEKRSTCFAYRNDLGEFCWLTTGNWWQGSRLDSREAKLTKCRNCPVMTRWLPV